MKFISELSKNGGWARCIKSQDSDLGTGNKKDIIGLRLSSSLSLYMMNNSYYVSRMPRGQLLLSHAICAEDKNLGNDF